EIADLARGRAHSFSCGGPCCGGLIGHDRWMDPGSAIEVIGNQGRLFTPFKRLKDNCTGAIFGPYDQTYDSTWSSGDTSVVTTNQTGWLNCVGVGSTGIQASWEETVAYDGACVAIVVAVATGAGIDVCETGVIEPFSPDPYGVDTANLTSPTQAALACLETAVSNAGGSLTVTSAYRPQDYQDHLREVWDKYQIVSAWPQGQCTSVRQNVEAEWNLHDLVFQPAATSHHSSGTAFDATWSLPQGYDIDTLASGCDLSRPVPGDPVHFSYTP
ncbi:MAG: hypothetical protein ACRD1R_18660, partial [Acidobacteriota bacterium]